MTRQLGQRLVGVAALTTIAIVASLAFARPGLVTTNDKQQFEGDVSEFEDQVTVVRKGLTTTLPRANVASIDYASFAERFARSLDKLAPDDVAGRVALGRQAFDHGDYDLAERALSAALDIDPLDRDARKLYATVSRQMNLRPRGAAPPTPAATRPTTTPAARGPASRRPGLRVFGLSDEQVNLVRQAELRRGDRVRIRFAENVRKRFVDAQPGMSFQQFATLDDADQALAIFTKGTPDQIDDVHLLSDPSSIQTYASRLNGPIVKGCATSFCHGGEDAGRFRLLGGVADPSTAITNFYLLATFAKVEAPAPGSMFGGAQLTMISRGFAVDSLLYQYALPRSLARSKHPIVRGWDGLFRNADDRLAREIVEWINLGLNPLAPAYGFDYKPGPSRQPAATVPATAPAE